jgi:hypothetical protein
MFEKWRSEGHLELVDASGRHIGVADAVVANRIKLLGSDADGPCHFLDWESVERIEDNRVYLKQGTRLPDFGTGMGGSGVH